jgi:hypothetical protein
MRYLTIDFAQRGAGVAPAQPEDRPVEDSFQAFLTAGDVRDRGVVDDLLLEALEVLVALADRFADAALSGSVALLDDRLRLAIVDRASGSLRTACE